MQDSVFEDIQKQYQYIIQNSGFYKKKFQDIVSMEKKDDFFKLPFTTKTEVLSDQEKHPPFGANICVPAGKISRIHKTSGTTNKPVMIAMTKRDIEYTVEAGSACFRASGLTPDDIVIHCLNYNMWAGGYTDHQSLEKTGATVVPFGVGNSRLLIETILQLNATAIHCTPSYLSKLEYLLREEFDRLPGDLPLRLGLFGAESGLQHRNFRQQIERTWELKAMNANYGMSEVFSIFGAECEHQRGMHFMGGNALYPELIDHKTSSSLKIEEGAMGELVLTNLYREAQPLFRYRSGDIIRILDMKCPCGRSSFRFEIMGRTDDMLVIKGLNIFPGSIEHIVNQYVDHISNTYQILVSKTNPIEDIKLVLELKKGNTIQESQLMKNVTDDFVENLGISPRIEFVHEGVLPRTEGKSKKFQRIL
ncbi:MAG: phenylacetate--CoA ligase [Desulfobacteraceae bacterium]|nr:phenylacetate--CoA ligase [Desulfobacteraceae bacterium]